MKTQVNFKIDTKLKTIVQKKAKKLGISLNDIVSSSFREFSRADELDIRPIYYMSPKLEKIAKRAVAQHKKGKTFGPFRTVEDLMTSLRSNQ